MTGDEGILITGASTVSNQKEVQAECAGNAVAQVLNDVGEMIITKNVNSFGSLLENLK